MGRGGTTDFHVRQGEFDGLGSPSYRSINSPSRVGLPSPIPRVAPGRCDLPSVTLAESDFALSIRLQFPPPLALSKQFAVELDPNHHFSKVLATR